MYGQFQLSDYVQQDICGQQTASLSSKYAKNVLATPLREPRSLPANPQLNFWVIRRGKGSNNEVNQRHARLVLGWVTVSWFNSWCVTFISVCHQPPRSTQPFVGRRNEYQPNGGDVLQLESKDRYGPCVGGR